jgi:lipoprotein-releasing system permease protein
VRLAIIAVGLSSAVMFIALSTVSGFQSGIKNKVIGINGDLVIDDISNTEGSEPIPMLAKQLAFTPDIESVQGVQSVAVCAVRPCIVKGQNEIEGMVAKGISFNYDFTFFKNHLKRGTVPDFARDTNTAIISDLTAGRLGLDTGMYLQAIFFKEDSSGNRRPRAINPRIVGVFSTGLDDYDKAHFITHIGLVQKVMPQSTKFTQWELRLNGNIPATEVVDKISRKLPPGTFNIQAADRYNRQIFDWLTLLDTNVVIILTLMLLVAVIGMCTTLLILITERTHMIGTLKALGAKESGIRSIFQYQVIFITGMGLLLGNIVGLGFCWLQCKYGFITLNTETYYVNKVLIQFNPTQIFWVNVGTILICWLVLYLPARVIGRLSPIKSIKFQ